MRYILLSLVFLFNINKSHSQNDGALAAGALLVGGLGIIASIKKK
jgi:LPXTG-motif cell wall-anchored protein